MKIPTLLTFLKGNSDPKANMPGCANYDRFDEECFLYKLDDFLAIGDCVVLNKQSCPYFEKAVLPVAYQNGYGDRMTDLYNKQTGAKIRVKNKPKVRECPTKDCDNILKPRQRLCSKCKIKKRRETYRNEKRKQRK